MQCQNLDSCLRRRLRRRAWMDRKRDFAEALHSDFVGKLNEGRATLLDSFHSDYRKIDRLYSARDTLTAVTEGWVIHYSEKPMTITVMSYVRTGNKMYRPIHVICDVGNPLVWRIITVLDPSERTWKWDEQYEEQTCFCQH